MDKAITTAILIIASVIASVALINAVLPAIGDSSGALSAANASAADRIRTDIEIVHVAADTDAVGGEDQVLVWVKNIGSQKIAPITSSDIFLITSTTVKRLSHGSGTEYWDYTVEGGGSDWTQAVTIKITLHLDDLSVVAGAYTVTVAAYNGVSTTKDFSV